jgi:hypothetical protein
VRKSNSSEKKSNFSVKKILFFTLASMKKSLFGKEKYFTWKNERQSAWPFSAYSTVLAPALMFYGFSQLVFG